MGKALQVVSGYVTNTSGTTVFDPVTPAPNDLLAVNDYSPGSKAWMINAWGDVTAPSTLRVRSPNFHDDVNGISLLAPTKTPTSLMDGYSKQLLQKNDLLTVEINDPGSGGPDGITMLHFYEDLPGADASLFRWMEIENRIVELMTCHVTVTTGAGTAGAYEGAVGMTAAQNLFKSEGLYALLGYTSEVNLQTVGVTGTDTSNRRVGGPGASPDVMDTREWFVKESNESGYPCIPVFRTQNLQSTVVDVIDPEANASGGTGIEFLFARLSG